jgi:hypothetical protein
MSYIGRQISNLSDRVKLDSITTSATATYNLLLNGVAYVPSSAESLTVSLNGVVQAPVDSYTCSGSTITFASTLSASDSIDFILAERSITLQTPSAGSVGLTQLSATGTKDATTFLRGDNTFATVTSTTINNNADNRVITGSGTANTLEGEANLTFDGTNLDLPDSKLMRFGTGNDFSIQHNGSNTILTNSTGDFQIRATATGQDFYVYSSDGVTTRMRIIGSNGYLQCAGVYNQSAGDSANVVVDGSGNIYRSTSALKYKQDVRDLESIDISSFRPVRYKSKSPKDDPNKDFIGFIADEFHDAGLTELVSYGEPDEEGNPVVEGFNYDRLTAVLTKALQEANTKIATLEAENTDIKARLTALENA